MPKKSFIKRIRNNFGTKKPIIDMPDLISMQKESYEDFLQRKTEPEKRQDIGLQAVFKSVFPIRDFTNTASLEFVSYVFGVENSEKDCLYRGMTYEIPIRIRVRLVVFDVDKEKNTQSIRDIKEQEIYFGSIPLMTRRGTFILNGTERVVVSQLHRSPGVFFDHDKGKSHSSGEVIYSSRIIPVRGSWIDMEVDYKGFIYIKIDRRRKIPFTVLLKALGYSAEDMLDYFYEKENYLLKAGKIFMKVDEQSLKRKKAVSDVIDPTTEKIILRKGRIFNKKVLKRLEELDITLIPVEIEDIIGKRVAESVSGKDDKVILNAGETITEEKLELMMQEKEKSFDALFLDSHASSDSIAKTLEIDKVSNKEEALIEIYRRLRPGNPATAELSQDFIDHLFFKSAHYDLSDVGRMKMNHRLNVKGSETIQTLRKEDILLTAKTLIHLRDTQGIVDDIDHLGNRRVRAVGELMKNQYRIGLVRMERAIKERMSMHEVDSFMPGDLVNPKPVSAVVKEFFGTSQLSQFMDQTNPLSETTHKRRLSALGPGGLTRERAGFEVRDVHSSHYGRICPIETPEGPNIGLIVSLCTYAKVNKFGFIETPYRVVDDCVVTDEIKMLSAFEEGARPIAQADAALDDKKAFIEDKITCRISGEAEVAEKEKIELMDISPNQLVSISSSLIPFLENDDANRALMGSNMMRQAVPVLNPAAPLVGTGIENIVARDSGVTCIADEDAQIVEVDASRIVMKSCKEDAKVIISKLSKFERTNQNTCFNQRPIVKKGQFVKKGEIIADGPATENGELALGKNITVAFMPWGGYNFEDSILVSEQLVRDGVYTSVHIEEFEIIARDTKLGPEEITRDIPNVGEDALSDLDESGIIRIGAKISSGDILVGKVTPKGETQLSPEEKLLRAIFGEKAGDVKDSSLRVPPSVSGVVIDTKAFIRRGVEKDKRIKAMEDTEIAELEKDKNDKIRILGEITYESLEKILVNKKTDFALKKKKKVLIDANVKISKKMIDQIPLSDFEDLVFKDEKLTEEVQKTIQRYKDQIQASKDEFSSLVEKYEKRVDLPPGIIKLIKVYVAVKRDLSVGDKMAGRHGNKGVVSRVLPIEDLPYFSDGRVVDMVLNPLGVPSRMNVGQILEIHLGRAARELGRQIEELLEEKKTKALREKLVKIFFQQEDKDKIKKYSDDEIFEFAKYYKQGVQTATPVFDGIKEETIKGLLKEAEVMTTGQATLYDGRTGEKFDGEITVGTMYVMKLHHLVDDKIHARSIGPYSLITQQPLGGKAQFGGQRLGEMEVWAMEAYGCANSLQEFLTVKSDDMAGRTRMYEKIVKGQNVLEPGIPESFRVLTKELQALGLNIEMLQD